MASETEDIIMEPDEENVFCCAGCHSLYILVDEGLATDDWDGSYCGKCGSCDIREVPFPVWQEEERVREQARKFREWNVQ